MSTSIRAVRNWWTPFEGLSEGQLTFPDEAVRRIFRLIRAGHGTARPVLEVLTARQREILRLFASGNSYSEIGEAMRISNVTARNSVYRIQDKLRLRTKQDLVVWAVRNGLLDEAE